MLGTFLLVLIGNGSVAQVTLGKIGDGNDQSFGDFQSIALGNGLALIIGLIVSIPLSGGHLNPAVTVAFAVVRKCSWAQVTIIGILSKTFNSVSTSSRLEGSVDNILKIFAELSAPRSSFSFKLIIPIDT